MLNNIVRHLLDKTKPLGQRTNGFIISSGSFHCGIGGGCHEDVYWLRGYRSEWLEYFGGQETPEWFSNQLPGSTNPLPWNGEGYEEW